MEIEVGVAKRREREKAQRRQAILDAAAALFAEHGLLNVKMVDVARKCELSTGALYLYFKSKEDIFAALAILGTREIDQVLSAHFQNHDQPLNKGDLVILLEKLIRVYSEYGGYFDTLKNHYLGNKEMAITKAHEQEQEQIQMEIFAKMVVYFRGQQELGVVSRDWNLDDLCFILWAQLLGVAQVLGEEHKRFLVGQNMSLFLKEYARFILSALARSS